MTKTNCDCPNTDPARGANLVDLYKIYTDVLIKPGNCDLTTCQESFNAHLYATYRFAVANIDLNCLRTLSEKQITCLIDKLDLYSTKMVKDIPVLTCVDLCAFSAYLTPMSSGMSGIIIAGTPSIPITVDISTSTPTPINPSTVEEWVNSGNYNLPCSNLDDTCSDATRTYSAEVIAIISHNQAFSGISIVTNMTLSIKGIPSDEEFLVPPDANTSISNTFTIKNIPCGVDISNVTALLSASVNQNVTVTINKITFTSESESDAC
jgi:hypothetical protein